MYKKCIKKIFAWIVILVLITHVTAPAVVLAQEVPTDTPTPTTVDQSSVNNNATVGSGVDSSANTGSNTTTATDTPTPTPDPNATPTIDPNTTVTPTPTVDPNITDTPTPTIDPNATPTIDPSITVDPNATGSSDISVTNGADVNNDTSSTSNTGSNTTSSTGNNLSQPVSTPTPTPTPQITVQTGNAVSVVAGDNTINTTSINSDVTDQTINVYGDQTGDIDLSTLFQLVSNIVTGDNNTNPVINVQITGVNNYAYLDNTINSSANTGSNTTSGTGGVVVNTGNADSVVTLINKVNLTVVNSSLHLVTINIFGHLSGNIILPNIAPLQSTSCSLCGVSFDTNNQATVNNAVSSTANTGSNTTNASGGNATLTTGNAESDVNAVNLVNTTALGTIFENLFINEFGYWNGSFLGWDGFGPAGNGSLALSSGVPAGQGSPTGSISYTNVNNTAIVNNNISSLANTGGNTTNGSNATVTTGDAYSAVSLINFVNSTFFKSLGFFGFINIFGEWDGNIGGADKFVTPTPTPSQDVVTSDTVPPLEDGGALSVENSNNVGAYVLPGDTVTFFIKAHNIGTGKVYGAKLYLYLVHNGQNVGGSTYNLGDISAGHGVRVTTGLVLSKDAAPGDYIARAEVTGTTGPNATPVSASADSTFTIFGTTLTTATNPQLPTTILGGHKAILGASTNHNANTDQPLYVALLGILLGYLVVRILRAREQFILLFTQKGNFKSRLSTLRLFLL